MSKGPMEADQSQGSVQIELVPVELAPGTECHAHPNGDYDATCGVRSSLGIMDATGGLSDCNRARGRLYRVQDLGGPSYPSDEGNIMVSVRTADLPKFDKVWETWNVDTERRMVVEGSIDPRCTSGVVFEDLWEGPIQKRCILTDPHGASGELHLFVSATDSDGEALVIRWFGDGVNNRPSEMLNAKVQRLITASPMRQALDIMDTIARDAGVELDEDFSETPGWAEVAKTIIPQANMDERGKNEYMLRRMAAWAKWLVDNLPIETED